MGSVPQSVIKHKVGLLNLAAELGNMSRACKVMGFSRDTFYRYQSAVEAGGVDALIDANRKKPNLKNRVDEATEAAVVNFALVQPAFGQVRVSNELRKRAIFVSPSGVRSIWLRRDLESFKKRLAALERHVAETGEVLTEAQDVALERKQDDDVPAAGAPLSSRAHSPARAHNPRQALDRVVHVRGRHLAITKQQSGPGRRAQAGFMTRHAVHGDARRQRGVADAVVA
jgi:hypothetical protein